MYQEKFPYPKVKREYTSETGRTYFMVLDGVEYDPVYSVTTILSKTSDSKEAIEDWRNTIGHEQADAILAKSINIGNCMHDLLYHQVIETPNPETLFKQNFIFRLASKMAKNIWDIGLKDVDEFWGAEVPLFVPNCYAGRTDLVGLYKGVPSIIDFKNSYKEKKEEYLEDYYIQSAAYAVAHDALFGTDIQQCVILIANSSDQSARKFIKSGSDFVHYKNAWLDRLDSFYHK